jgi:hypothetical protein
LTVNGAVKLRNVDVTDITAAGNTPFVTSMGGLLGTGTTNVIVGGGQTPSLLSSYNVGGFF